MPPSGRGAAGTRARREMSFLLSSVPPLPRLIESKCSPWPLVDFGGFVSLTGFSSLEREAA